MDYKSKAPIAIISGEKKGLTDDQNAIRTDNLARALFKGLSKEGLFLPVKGCWKGTHEVSFKVNITNDVDFDCVLTLARMFDQESVLVIDEEREAWSFLSDDSQYLGHFVAVSKGEALPASWTFDPESDTYFIVKR